MNAIHLKKIRDHTKHNKVIKKKRGKNNVIIHLRFMDPYEVFPPRKGAG
jgi:hypothetical protein